MKTELNPTLRLTGTSRQFVEVGTPHASYGDDVSVGVGWFGAIARPIVRPTNPHVA